MLNQNPDILRGRQEIADYLQIHPDTLYLWRQRARKKGDPMPILRPGGGEIQASKNELESWRMRQYA